MGVEPLPFDQRIGCWCSFGCPDFHKPEQRYWVVIDTGGEEPRLDEGVLYQRLPPFPLGLVCIWTADPPFPPATATRLIKGPAGTFANQSYFWQFQFEDPVPPFTYDAKAEFPLVQCGSQLGWVAQTAPPGWGLTTIIPVKWFQNADDVPH